MNRVSSLEQHSAMASQQVLHTNVVFPQNEVQNPEEGLGACGMVLVVLSYILFAFTFPFSLFLALKVIKEYERVVILRLGRTLTVGTKGPGLLFVLPWIDSMNKVDLRTG
ncbi:unnamed protein product [Rotaria sp. Silwood2]|nr:unnamed protein product [Rotaria sp. Silwood2]CAF4461109.1 unnamed protein product [Rotaria sp. Silwood2]